MVKTHLTFSEALAVYKSRKYAMENFLYDSNEEIEDNFGENLFLAAEIVDKLAALSPEAIMCVEKEIQRVHLVDKQQKTHEEKHQDVEDEDYLPFNMEEPKKVPQVLCAFIELRDRRSNEIVEEEWHKVASERTPHFGDMVHFNCEDKGMITAVAYKPVKETQWMWTIGDAPDEGSITWWGIVARPEIEENDCPF